MAGSPKQSEYLYGLHDAGGEHTMLDKGIAGWVLETKASASIPTTKVDGTIAFSPTAGLRS